MKSLILFLVFASFNSFAGYVAGSKINQCDRTDYISPYLCQESENEICYKVPNDSGECGIFKLKNIHSSESVNEESCLGDSCLELLQNKVCSVNHTAFINDAFTGVYCREIIGKELVVDNLLKALKDSERAAKSQVEFLISSGKKAREDCQKVLDLIGGFNLLPGRSSEQAGEMIATFSAAKTALQDGRPGAAKIAIQAIPVDGVLVTEAMKSIALDILKDW